VTARLFIAIWPDEASRDALVTTVHEARTAAPDIRWQPAERWHVTLAFLGQADPEESRRRIAAHVITGLPAPEPVRLAGAGAFGSVIWVGVEHGPWLGDLASGLQRALRVADRRFRAHVTVGRVRGEGGPARAREVVPLLRPHDGPGWTPAELTLVESSTGPAPEYRICDRWPLGPPRPAARRSTTNLDTPGSAMPDSAASATLEVP
jgi:RNA 2',3'-cyclic 3'-phosphodiesterase